MKLEISIPNPIFESAQQLSQKLGMTLGELYTAALAAYVATYQDSDITEALDRVYETEHSELDPVLVQIQAVSIPSEPW